jgi:glycosyl transferase family 87
VATHGKLTEVQRRVAPVTSRTLANLTLWSVLVALPVFVGLDVATHFASTDFRCFYTAAQMVRENADPYDQVSWSERTGAPARDNAGNLRESPCARRFAYPLWTAAAFVPLALLPATAAAAIWELILVAGATAGTVLIWRAAATGPALAFGALVLTSQPFWFTLETAQFGGLLLGLIGLLLWSASKRHAVAGIPLALLLLKPHITFLVLGTGTLWLARHARKAALVGGAFGLALLVMSFALRPDWIGVWLVDISGPERSAVTNNHTTVWHLASLVGAPAWVAIFAIFPLVFVLVREIARDDVPLIDLLAVAAVSGLLISPYQGSYDQLIVVVVWGRALALGLTLGGAFRSLFLVGVVAAASVIPWTLYAISLQSRPDETLNALALVTTGLVLYAALRAARLQRLGGQTRPLPISSSVAAASAGILAVSSAPALLEPGDVLDITRRRGS